MNRRLAEAWNDFRAKAIPRTASATQVREMRKSFFAGAATFFDIQLNAYADDTNDPTPEELQVITDLHDEIQEFAADVAAGKL